MNEPNQEVAPVITATPAANDPQPEFLTVDEAAAMLRVNRGTLYEVIKAGDAPWAKCIGRQVRISRSAMLKWFEQEAAQPKRRRAL